MYVITFYSFKGGVGRTLALVNIGAQLALEGKSVLLVDFDLEAPGLDSFPALRSDQTIPGIVEFVTDYLDSGTAPLATNYIADCRVPGIRKGKISLMRSGIAKQDYSVRLSSIDWQRLYSEQDGFLLFEDLKAQWDEYVKPDYVLIDSRTGHTDVGGICTRQLPNAVVACFIPNEENISGLETVAANIRTQSKQPGGQPIELHFVLSNIPYLDDEKGILAKHLKYAKTRLGFEQPAATLHRYDSLSLLENDVFVLGRRRTRLAKEYRRLATFVTNRNLEDRDVALRILASSSDLPEVLASADRSVRTTLEKIQNFHAKDGEVLYAASQINRKLGRTDQADALLQRSKQLGFRSAEMMLESVASKLQSGDRDGALIDLVQSLDHPAADYFVVSRAIEICLQSVSSWLETVAHSKAFRNLHPAVQSGLCEQMFVRRDVLPTAETILREIAANPDMGADLVRVNLMLCVIGQGKFEEAGRVLSEHRPDPSSLDMADAFNYGFAEWGTARQPPIDFFTRVLELGRDIEPRAAGKNTLQCLSMAAWVAGEQEVALELWQNASLLAAVDSSYSFSGWRYLRVSPAQFRDDLQELSKMIHGASVQPQVLSEFPNGTCSSGPQTQV